MKFILAVILGSFPAFAQTAPMPRLLTRPGDIDVLPEVVRQKMVEAEKKTDLAREKFEAWHRARPNPGYETVVELRRIEFLNARNEAIESILSVAGETPGLETFRQKIIFGWTCRIKKLIPRIPKRSASDRAPRAGLFYSLNVLSAGIEQNFDERNFLETCLPAGRPPVWRIRIRKIGLRGENENCVFIFTSLPIYNTFPRLGTGRGSPAPSAVQFPPRA